jgi:hypothetical protein
MPASDRHLWIVPREGRTRCGTGASERTEVVGMARTGGLMARTLAISDGVRRFPRGPRSLVSRTHRDGFGCGPGRQDRTGGSRRPDRYTGGRGRTARLSHFRPAAGICRLALPEGRGLHFVPGGFTGSPENRGFARIRQHRRFPSHWRQIAFQTTVGLRGARKQARNKGISGQYQAPHAAATGFLHLRHSCNL